MDAHAITAIAPASIVLMRGETILIRVSDFFQIRKKVHWSDTDAAGVVWFPNFLRWFEDAEEELFASLGRSRQSLIDSHQFGMPRVEVQTRFRAPARAGQSVRVGIRTTIENPRRLHHAFEIRDDHSDALLAEGFVRVACVDSATWSPRDLPDDVLRLVSGLPDLAARQARGAVELPWT
jgi:YbgC/YbaW family acyl-CoA thioester hydrolase